MTDFDFIIVGAGTAGCVLASRLSADPACQVLLIEAGGADAHPLLRMPIAFTKVVARPDWNWRLHSEPEAHLNGRVIPVPRGRVLGGSSSINGMFHIRGHRLDFDDWRDAGCAAWGYDDVLPYFKRSESHWLAGATPANTARHGADGPARHGADGRARHGADGPDWHGADGPVPVRAIDTTHLLMAPLREAARQAGHAINDDYDGAAQDGFARGSVAITARGRRASSARAYLRPVRHRKNLTVLTHAQVQRVLLEQGRATGVALMHGGSVQQIRARREVILCAGAYHSPQLLMLSGIGPADELQRHGIDIHHALSGVGANLIEHPRMMLMYKARLPVTFIRQLRFDRAVVSALRWALCGSGPFATQVCSGTVLLRSQPGLDRPDIQLLCNPVRLDAGLWFPGVVAPKEHAFYISVCLLGQHSRGRVSLRSASAADAPRIAFNLFSDARDVQRLRNGLRAARAIYAQAPMADLIEAETLPGAACQSDAEIDASIRELGGITHHPVGTCAMGVGENAVVDAQLRVHGIRGLRVADASIMPTIPGGNTNAATLMIAEKASDLILEHALQRTPTP